MQTSNDSQLVKHVLSGRTDAFRGLVERHQRSVTRIIGNLIPDRHDAEDLAQETFVAAFSSLASYDESRAAFSTWLLTIARNRCVNWLKRKRVARPGEFAEPTGGRTPDAVTEEREFFREFDAALETLPLTQRTAFVLAEIEGLPHAEIAEIESATIGTVKSRVHRAKQRLKSLLEPTLRDTE